MGVFYLQLKSKKTFYIQEERKWLVLSKLPANLLEEKPPGSSLPPRLLVSLPQQQEESKNLTGTGLARWLSGKLGDTRSPRSCSSVSYLFQRLVREIAQDF